MKENTMLQVKIYFWTKGKKSDRLIQRLCVSKGRVTIPASKAHGIKSGIKPTDFASLLHLPYAIEQQMRKHNITIKPASKMFGKETKKRGKK